ncbi:hypothetical protein ACWT_4191 [Actinoplanes sp. SE50]|uniref:VOC family protein n=1 Tax=unclassified Actinoplanes TaxID=2626549 RepID=UPI00023EC2BF|nr:MULTISPECIES: VOC family protein [unclassified Actinoplanes]AEV85211.1 hypothetical protein ACPL_4320 [Actinoplanes sp. SE50/110]ATO83606.1 hypothetical protein ACWT_4191 [Actinoplanes sp. SE50]SLM01013.1 uncharacterized protein ACSP50_4246 [Actinoplanes sp. SE50/110]
MTIRWVTGFLDSPAGLAAAGERFWLAVTGSVMSPRRGGGTFATLLPPAGDPWLRVQVVGDGPARTHLDLHVDDFAGFEVPGARVVDRQDDVMVLRSPAGIVFCVVPWSGEKIVALDRSAVVDQVCLDIPDQLYEVEAAFWTALTGWARTPSGAPEFEHLTPPPTLPMKLLLQRVGAGPAGMHLDWACTDVPGEVARHESLGATVVRRVPGDWTTLRDPAGREYCLTARPPRRPG